MVLTRLAMPTLSWEVILPAATSLSPSFTLSMAACENSTSGLHTSKWALIFLFPNEYCYLVELLIDVPYERQWCLGSIRGDPYTHCLSPLGSEGLSLATVGKKITLKEEQREITGNSKPIWKWYGRIRGNDTSQESVLSFIGIQIT